MKIIVNTSAKDYRRDPDCVSKKEKFWRERKRYKKLIISKKRTTAEFHSQLSILRTSHPRDFWKIVSKAAVVQRNYIPIDMVNMATHFQTLNTQYLDPPHICNKLPVFTSDDFLDEEILKRKFFGPSRD